MTSDTTTFDATLTEPEPIPVVKPYSKIRAAYNPIEEVWNEAVKRGSFSNLTETSATRAIKRSRSFFYGKRCNNGFVKVRMTSGRNQTIWKDGRGYEWSVNPENTNMIGGGWADLIHTLSHLFGQGHSKKHARLELRLAKMAIARGWPWGSLEPKRIEKPEPTRDELRSKKIELRKAQVDRLERKIKSLTTRMRNARRSLAALVRAQESR